ncbi:MAG TPA: CusA/CzcA family heavy metal efflux RND transporter [Candidatus Acidoferrum sp.]|nr:CusA/CzcA family heavy metal efflux RND transporter [Candidatus Acidoferrum sp.]
MIQRLVDFALENRFLVLALAVLLFGWGALSFHVLPVEAYPDVADNYVEIITQWPGISAEQVEQQVTVPLEIAMNGIPHVAHLRSFSLFGLSDLKLIFDDVEANAWNRERVLERLSQVALPPGVTPQMGTDWSPVGQIYFYTLRSTNPAYDVMNLKSLQDWVVQKNFKAVPDVVDVSSFGGPAREYQIRLDPDKLVAYGLSLAQIEQQLAANNANAGGSFIESGLQQINLREVGLFTSAQDIAQTVIVAKNGTPLRIGDVAEVAQGPKIRLGQTGRAIHREDGKIIDNPDVVSGIVLLRKGANAEKVLKAIHEKVRELNGRILPRGVKVVPFIDRSDLVRFTTHTVLHNLTAGIALVVVVLFLLLGNFRGAIIVALTVPFSLLFAALCLNLKGIPANLLSLGALDFGMVVDGSVVMVENIVRHLSKRSDSQDSPATLNVLRGAAHEVQRPVFYAIAIIITAYLPIFTLQRVEGRLFKPMAWTVAFALLGALLFSMLIAPVLSTFFFRGPVREWHNPVMTFLTDRYRKALRSAIHWRGLTVGVGIAGLCLGAFLIYSGVIGSEFLPHLDEGALWVRGTLAPSTGPTNGIQVANQARIILCSFPEVPQCWSQVGRPDDGTDTTGFFNVEFFVDLKPAGRWRPVFHQNKDELIAAMNRELNRRIPGVVWGFSQPIEDNMEEAVSGVKGELATKIYGDDLKTLEAKANEVIGVMRQVQGVSDLGVFQVLGQPSINFVVNRDAAARYQINVADVQDAIQTAAGGGAVTQVLQGEARYDVVLRYQPQFRNTREALENIRLLSPSGERVSLAQLCTVRQEDGASEIYREGNERYVAIKYSVRGRDLGSTVEEAIRKVSEKVQMPRGYHIDWEGEYESEKRARARLFVVVPVTVLGIFIILYTMFRSPKWTLLILATVAMASIGGLLALLVTGTNFSVSSGVGFLALFGVAVQTGVIMLEYINQLRADGHSIEESAVEGAVLRLRPIMMTMLVATLGLLPAAMSHAIGSDSQRPFAIVIVGGLTVNLLMSIFILPTLYVWFAGNGDTLPAPDAGFES